MSFLIKKVKIIWRICNSHYKATYLCGMNELEQQSYEIRQCVLRDKIHEVMELHGDYLSETAQAKVAARTDELVAQFARIADCAVHVEISPGDALTFTAFINHEIHIIVDIPLLGIADEGAREGDAVFSVMVNKELQSAGALPVAQTVEGILGTINLNAA